MERCQKLLHLRIFYILNKSLIWVSNWLKVQPDDCSENFTSYMCLKRLQQESWTATLYKTDLNKRTRPISFKSKGHASSAIKVNQN